MSAIVTKVIELLFTSKYGALACLVLQNTFLVVYMNISRTAKGNMYASSTAVVSMECLKIVTCVCVMIWEKKSIKLAWDSIYQETWVNTKEVVSVSVPSFLYCVQNNLLYFALTHLDAATFQVGYQLKILTTAVFSVFMLNKHLSLMQWFSLVILTIGVAMAQYSSQASKSASQNSTLGFLAVLAAAVTSGYAGVYFEKQLKGGSTSLWMRNFHLGLSSVPLGFVMIYFSGELPGVLEKGFFYGYNRTVLFVIVLQAIGGLVVAVVVKYADNILKGFAAAFSILTSCTMCYFWFDFHPTFIFLLGALLVTVSMYLYSLQPAAKPKSGDEISQPNTPSTSLNGSSGGSSLRFISPEGSGGSSSGRMLVPSGQGSDNV